jgi:hypothetical protein
MAETKHPTKKYTSLCERFALRSPYAPWPFRGLDIVAICDRFVSGWGETHFSFKFLFTGHESFGRRPLNRLETQLVIAWSSNYRRGRRSRPLARLNDRRFILLFW